MMNKIHSDKPFLQMLLLTMALLLLMPVLAGAQSLSKRYTTERPVIIVCDWDKPPYEFLDDDGRPTGSNIDVMKAIMEQLDIPCKFVMKEWNNAIKTFERGEADLIFANRSRFRNKALAATQIITYDRIMVAMATETPDSISIRQLEREGFVLKSGDYTAMDILGVDSAYRTNIEFQSPSVALSGLLAGDNKYFVWGEEPLKWKIKKLNLTDIYLNEVDAPVNKVHIIGRDKELIDRIDDQFSRLKQSGKLKQILDRWLHPEQVHSHTPPYVVYIVMAILLLSALISFFSRLTKKRVRKAMRRSSEMNGIMMKALQMDNYIVMEYDIKADRMTNRYGNVLPAKGLTFDQFARRIHPDQQAEFRHHAEQLLSGHSRHFNLKKRWNAGTDDQPRWLSFHGHAIVELDDEGQPAYIVNAIHDVTEEVEQEQAAYERDCCYTALTNQSTVAMSFYSSDGRLLELNNMMKDICGFDNDPDAEHYWRSLNMFNVPLFRNALADSDGLAVCQHMVYPNIGVDKFVEVNIRPLYDSSGENITSYVLTAVDMTDERNNIHKMHQQLKEERQAVRYTALQKNWLAYLLRHSERYIVRSNIARQHIEFFRSPDAPSFAHSFEAFYEMLEEAEREPFRRLVNDAVTLSPQQFTIHLTERSSGSVDGDSGLVFSIVFIPIFDARGNIIGHEGISSDITRLCNARLQLADVTARAKDSNKLKSAFMASMTHELRTPLNAIMGFTGVLDALGDSPERAEYVRIIRNSSDMLQRLINDIIEASSLTSALTASVPAAVDFAAAFDDICMTLRQRIPDGIVFVVDNPCQTLPAMLDTARIQQVVTNFVTNAVKFTREGHIRVGYRVEKRKTGDERREGLYVYCEDTGIGIPKEKQKMVFERFVKLDEFVQGTGMGLAISKSIVERCGGMIGVDSAGPGAGSTFWFWIPCEYT